MNIINLLTIKLGKDNPDEMINYVNICCEKNIYPYKLFKSTNYDSVEIGKEYELNSTEIAITNLMGPERTKAARKSGKTNMLQCEKEKEKFIEINGLQGELLYAKLFNLFPKEQLTIRPRKISEDFGDFYHNNLKIDVKTTEYSFGRLTLSSWKAAEHIDGLCLFTGMQGKFTLRGFCLTKDLIKASNFKNLPGRTKKQYIMEQTQLISYEKFHKRL